MEAAGWSVSAYRFNDINNGCMNIRDKCAFFMDNIKKSIEVVLKRMKKKRINNCCCVMIGSVSHLCKIQIPFGYWMNLMEIDKRAILYKVQSKRNIK